MMAELVLIPSKLMKQLFEYEKIIKHKTSELSKASIELMLYYFEKNLVIFNIMQSNSFSFSTRFNEFLSGNPSFSTGFYKIISRETLVFFQPGEMGENIKCNWSVCH